MSLVDTTTGEVVQIATEADAVELVQRIDEQVRTVNTEAGVLVELCADALRSKAWVSLGYGSWSDLCDAKGWEFRPRTGTDRAALAQVMRENGMSYRAIGKLVGVSHEQVRNDVAGVKNLTPAPVPPQSDGDAEVIDFPGTVTGTDGKNYPAANPKADRLREDIADAKEAAAKLREDFPDVPPADPRVMQTVGAIATRCHDLVGLGLPNEVVDRCGPLVDDVIAEAREAERWLHLLITYWESDL